MFANSIQGHDSSETMPLYNHIEKAIARTQFLAPSIESKPHQVE